MSEDPSSDRTITDLLAAIRAGDRSAMDQLMPLVYDELRRRAHRLRSRHGRDAMLNTTGLVHEAYLRLVRAPGQAWDDRGHFYAVAVKAMRCVIVDEARRHLAEKRGGAVQLLPLADDLACVEKDATEVLAINRALERLEDLDQRLSSLVELRFFGGLSVDEAAEALGVSPRTVKRDWTKARTLLFQLLHEV
jgi:RNA polymerase sigma factor (TIGR02999 family)